MYIKKGITLIEVLVALVIISIALIATQQTINSTVANYTKLQQNILSSIISKNILIELILSDKVESKAKYKCEQNLPFFCQIIINPTANIFLISATILVYSDINALSTLQKNVTILQK